MQRTSVANYDLCTINNTVDREEFKPRTRGMWRWFELLPVREIENAVILSEGDAPLLKLKYLSQ
jgi:threonine synthase